MNPYEIEGPALISFSGGLTSAYMLRHILDAGLADDVHVVYANTGKERPETLDFVHEVSVRWGVKVTWIENGRGEVTYESANRTGVPFDELIEKAGYLPFPVGRYCTTELKIRPMKRHMLSLGYEAWSMVLGIRADEPSRIHRLRAPTKQRWEHELPLADAGVSLRDVTAFWKAQPFTLNLKPHEGNCDLCFLKSAGKRIRILRDRPDIGDWWEAHEKATGDCFRRGQPVARLRKHAVASPELPFASRDDADDLGDCVCHD